MENSNKKFEIRDTRNGTWHWVNDAVIACSHVTPYDKVVYSALSTFSGCKEIRPSFELIAERASISVRKAKEGIKKLIQVGYVLKITGGGKGKTNVYELVKAPKGCKFCTVSKQCRKRKQTVQVTTTNGADSAPQLDKELDKEKDSVSASPPPQFSFKKYTNELLKNKRRDLQLIGKFFTNRDISFQTKKQAEIAVKRHLKPASQLKEFEDKQIRWAVQEAEEKFPNIWTIETLIKLLTK